MRFSGKNNILDFFADTGLLFGGAVLSRYRGFVLANVVVSAGAFAAWVLWFASQPKLQILHLIAIAIIFAPMVVVGYLKQTGNFHRAISALVAILVAGLVFLVTQFLEYKYSLHAFPIVIAVIAVLPLFVLIKGQSPAVSVFCGAAGIVVIVATVPGNLISVLPQLVSFLLVSVSALIVGRSMNRKHAEIANARSEISNLIERSAQFVSRHTINGDTLYCSHHSQKILNFKQKSLLGAGYCNKIHLQDRIIFLKTISDVIHSGQEIECEVRIRIKARTGDNNARASAWRWMELRCSPYDKPGPNDEHSVTIVSKDISKYRHHGEVKSIVKEKSEAEEALDDLQPKIAEMRALAAASVADQKDIGFDDKLRDFLSDVAAASILSSPDDHQLNLEKLAVSEIVQAAIDRWENHHGKNVRLKKGDMLNLPQIASDIEILGQTFDELIDLVSKQFSAEQSLKITARRFGRSVKVFIQPASQCAVNSSNGFNLTSARSLALQKLITKLGGKLDWETELQEYRFPTITLPVQPKMALQVPADETAKFIRAEMRATKYQTSNQGESRARLSA